MIMPDPMRPFARESVPIQVLGRVWVLERCPVRPFAGLLAVMPVVPSAFALSVGGGPRQIVPVVETEP